MRRFPVGREGTVARSKLRTVASAGTLAAFLLVGGAAVPVVSADPGHSRDGNGSDRGSDSRRGDGDGRHGQGGAERGRDDGGWQRGGDSRGPDRTNDPSYPNSAVGASRTAELNPNRTEVASRAGTTARSDQVVTDSSGSRRSVTGEVTTATVIPEEPALPAVPIRPVAGGGGSGAAAVAAPGGSPVTAPSVTIGNGRSPGILTGRPDDAPSRAGVAPAVAGPAMTPAVVTPQLQPPDRLDVPPPQRAVAILWAAAAPGQPGGVLFGLVGLILAPIAGAWLGYRQARASRAAANLVPR